MYKVIATEILFYELARQRPGSEFFIKDFMEFSPVAMEFANEADHEAYQASLGEIVEKKKAIAKATKDAGLYPVPSAKAKPAAKKPLHEKAPSSKKSTVI